MADDTPWQWLLRFIEARVPGFNRRIQGASSADIGQLIECCTRTVPTSVFEMLSSISGVSGGFSPFGAQFTTAMDVLLEDLDEQCVADRFFRIATSVDSQGIGDADLYVDLHYSTGYDAPLIQVCSPWDRREPHARSHTLMSMAIACAFQTFELRRRGERGRLGQSIAVEGIDHYADAVRELAARMNLRSVCCPRTDLQCYANEDISLMFDAIGPSVPLGIVPKEESPPAWAYVSIWLGVADLETLRNVAEQVRDWMPPLPFFRRWLTDGPVDLAT